MTDFDWEVEKERRRDALKATPPGVRASRLLAELKDVGFLRNHTLGAGDGIFAQTVQAIERWGSVEASTPLFHAGDTVSLVIEGDHFEEGSYVREMLRFFAMTDGDIVPTDVRDVVDPQNEEVRILFNWQGEEHELRSRPPDGISDYFDSGILTELNRVLAKRGLPRRFVSFLDTEVQLSRWVYFDPARKAEIESRHLLIFDERIPYTRAALQFLW
jgi:hypothetical protein